VYATECLFARENDRIINGFVKRIFSILKKKTDFFYRIPLEFPIYIFSVFAALADLIFAVRVIAVLRFVLSGSNKCLDIPAITNAWTCRQLQMLGHAGH